MTEGKKQKLIHQLFIGKVSGLIGMDKATELLKESKEAFEQSHPIKPPK